MKHHFIDLKEEIALPNDVTLALSTVGGIVAIDADGTRRALDNDDHVRWFWYSVIGKFPERPRIPHDPAAQERARQAQAAIDARKQHSVTASKAVDGSVVLNLGDGSTVTLPTADRPDACFDQFIRNIGQTAGLMI